jgi:hypothetical protein
MGGDEYASHLGSSAMERPTGECPDGEASDRHGRARHDNRRVRDSEPWQAPSEPAIPDAGAMRVVYELALRSRRRDMGIDRAAMLRPWTSIS